MHPLLQDTAEVRFSLRASALLFFIIVLSASGCVQQEQQNQKILARVNEQTLTLEMVQGQIDTSQTITPVLLQQYTNRWITNELLFQEAKQRGMDISDDVQKKLVDARRQFAISALLEKEVYSSRNSEIKPEEIASYYQKYREEFILKQNLVWLSIAVFVENPPATEFRASALGNDGWDKSIDRFKSDPVKGMTAFSDSVFFTQSTLYPPELWKVATVLGRLEISFPVKTSAGYFVIRSLGQYPAGTTAPLYKVQETIQQRLTMERRQQRYAEFLESLRKKFQIQITVSPTDSLNH
jgi:peptidyl-prolyl cis-trans isomerase C